MLYTSFAVLASAALTSAFVHGPRASAAECETQNNACKTAPGANQAICAAQYSNCLGYNPYSNNTSSAVSPSATSGAYLAACATACSNAYNTCRVGTPGNSGNQAACYASYSNCLGFIPSGTATPTACSITTGMPTATNGAVFYTTITTDIYTTYCPYPTTVVQGSKTYTVTKATTLTITDCPCTVVSAVAHPAVETSAAVSACAASCQATYNTCRVGTPGNSGNQAACFADFSNCLGYIPSGTATPSVCSGTAAANAAASATVVVVPAAATEVAPVPAAVTSAAVSACAASCQATYNTCRVGTPGNSGNQAACFADFSNCLGYIPSGTATPSVCSGTAAANAVASATVVVVPVPAGPATAAAPAGSATAVVVAPAGSATAAVVVPAGSATAVVVPGASATVVVVPGAATPAVATQAPAASTGASRPAGTGLPICQIGDGQLQNAGACVTAPATAQPAASTMASSTRSVARVTATSAGPVAQYTGAASIEKPVYGFLAIGAIAALL